MVGGGGVVSGCGVVLLWLLSVGATVKFGFWLLSWLGFCCFRVIVCFVGGLSLPSS